MTLWKGFICVLVALAWYVLGAEREDTAIFARLAHQISSADDNFQKMSQAYPKGLRIIKAMSRQGGVITCFVSTCATIAKRKHLQEPDLEAQ